MTRFSKDGGEPPVWVALAGSTMVGVWKGSHASGCAAASGRGRGKIVMYGIDEYYELAL